MNRLPEKGDVLWWDSPVHGRVVLIVDWPPDPSDPVEFLAYSTLYGKVTCWGWDESFYTPVSLSALKEVADEN